MSVEIQASVLLKARKVYSDGLGLPFELGRGNMAPACIGSAGENPSIKLRAEVWDEKEVVGVKPQNDFEKISMAHGRSMTEAATSKKSVWGGPLPGDIYGARSLKGTAMYQGLRVEAGGIADYGVEAWGLMDDSCIDRVIRASEVLRRHGLPTEKPVLIQELAEIVKRKGTRTWEKISMSKWKKDLIKYPRQVIQSEINKYLSETKFVSFSRDVQVDERLRDIDFKIQNLGDLKEFLDPVFKWLNVATRYKNSGLIAGTPRPPVFNLKKDSIDNYFNNYLPKQMGTYLGRLHRLEIAHGFPHNQNWSVVGTLYDLDSVHGKAIFSDDGHPKRAQYTSDLSETIRGYIVTAEVVNKHLHGVHGLRFDNWDKKLKTLFVKSYVKERYGALGIIAKLRFASHSLVFD